MKATAKQVKMMSNDMFNKAVTFAASAIKQGSWLPNSDCDNGQWMMFCGWNDKGMSPLNRIAFVHDYGETQTAMIETAANEAIQASNSYWNNSKMKQHQDEATATEKELAKRLPKAGEFVWAYDAGLKCEDGLLHAVRNFCYKDERGPIKKVVKIEKVFNATHDEFLDPAIIVARYNTNESKDFPGGVTSDDADCNTFADYNKLTDEAKQTFYICAGAIVDKETNRWYLVDAEGYDYARYILFVGNYEEVFADEFKAQHKAINDEKEAEKAAEKAAYAQRLKAYKDRCAKWQHLMSNVRPFIDAVHNYRLGTKEAKDADRKLNNVRRHNILAMVQCAFPGVKFTLHRNHGWGAQWDLTWQDGPTMDEFKEKTDLGLFREAYDSFNGYDDSSTIEHEEFADFAVSFMGRGRTGDIDINREMSETAHNEIISKLSEIVPGCADHATKFGYGNYPFTSEDASKIQQAFNVEYSDISCYGTLSNCVDEMVRWIWNKQSYFKAPETTTTADNAAKVETTTDDKKEAVTGSFSMEKYSEKCYKLTGDTQPVKDMLREYGVWNRFKKCWFISNKKAPELADKLGITL